MVAILGGNPVISRALDVLLRSVGYEVRLLGEPEVSGVDDLLEGVDILLLGANLSDGYREDFLRAMASVPEAAAIPVLSFSPNPSGTLAAEERLLQWPCRTEDLARQIEAALLPAVEQELRSRQ